MSQADRRSWLEENLAALAARDPDLARAVRLSAPDPSITILRARNGKLVPACHRPEGRAPLHSLYDPERESRRLLESTGGSGCLVLLGLGGGYHLSAALEDPRVASLVVIEKDVAVIRALLELVPLAAALGDQRVRLLAGVGEIRSCLLSTWQPALMGSLQTVALRPWCDVQRDFFGSAVTELHLAVDSVRADYGVQAHFGKRWFSNILLNLEAAEKPPAELPVVTTAHVTAAGPSLEGHVEEIARSVRTGLLLATDTSLPALLRWGVTPHAVLSMDCQNHSYHHFLQGVPSGTTVFLDLASPPFLARRAGRLAFIASNHPFISYLGLRWRLFPRVDTSGGNVAHAAVSLARVLGARKITLHGADFSYPDGKPYSRGTYLYDLFDALQSRTTSTESRTYTFLHRSPDVKMERTGAGMIFTTTVLREYHDRMTRLMQEIDAEVVPSPGNGLALPHVTGRREAAASHTDAPASTGAVAAGLSTTASPARGGWREFLSVYAEELDGLDPARSPVGSRFHDRGDPQRPIWETIFPVAAQVVRETGEEAAGSLALEEARRWALDRVRRLLSRRRTTL